MWMQKSNKISYMRKRLCLDSWYMCLWDWRIIGNIIYDSVFTYDEVKDVVAKSETAPVNFNDEKSAYKMNYYIVHIFY